MNVYDVMTVQPTTINSDASLARALEIMNELSCHHLPVVSTAKHIIGILSFHDCQRTLGELLKGGGSPQNLELARQTRVAQVMTPAPIIVEPDAPAHEAARLMLEHFIGCLPVMRGETLIGIVTRSDLLMAFMILSQRPQTQVTPTH